MRYSVIITKNTVWATRNGLIVWMLDPKKAILTEHGFKAKITFGIPITVLLKMYTLTPAAAKYLETLKPKSNDQQAHT